MNVTVEHLAPCRKLVRVEVEAETVDKVFEEMTREVLRKASLPGFRPGKAPKHLVIKSHGAHIETEARRKLIGESLGQALKEQKLQYLGSPEIEEIQFGRGQACQFAATVETAPQFELPEYKGLPVKMETVSVTDNDVERAMNILRDQRATFKDVARPIQNGDIAVLNYTATAEGKPLTDFAPTAKGLTEKKDSWIEVKPGSFVDGFTEQLLGAQAGDKRTVKVTFPAEFIAPPLSGKEAVYEVEVTKVKEKELPEINDAFAKGFEAENLEKLREGVRADLEQQLKMNKDRSARAQVLAALSGRIDFELPESLLAAETKNSVYELVTENQKRGVPKEMIDQKKEEIFTAAAANAKERLKSAYLLTRIAEKEGLTVTRDEIGRRVYQLAQQNNIKPETLAKDLQENNGLGKVYEDILVAKALGFLVEQAKVEEVPPSAPLAIT